MAIIRDKYSENKVELIFQMLQGEQDAGNPKEYDIRVDDLKVISRTNDVERFWTHENFIQANSRNVTFYLYDGASRRCTRYILVINGAVDEEQQSLAGIERTIGERIVQERDKWEYEQLRKAYEEQSQKLREAEEYHDQLQDRITELEAEKNSRPNKLTETIIGLAGIYMAKNPKALNGIPIIGSLLGGSQAESTSEDQSSTEEPVLEATFEKTVEPNKYTGTISEADAASFRMALIPLFPEQYLEKVSEINRFMFHNHHIIDDVHNLLTDAAGKHPKQAA